MPRHGHGYLSAHLGRTRSARPMAVDVNSLIVVYTVTRLVQGPRATVEITMNSPLLKRTDGGLHSRASSEDYSSTTIHGKGPCDPT